AAPESGPPGESRCGATGEHPNGSDARAGGEAEENPGGGGAESHDRLSAGRVAASGRGDSPTSSSCCGAAARTSSRRACSCGPSNSSFGWKAGEATISCLAHARPGLRFPRCGGASWRFARGVCADLYNASEAVR
ncbi:unnamed protein product, partial [Symbiodinium microadriaticum]